MTRRNIPRRDSDAASWMRCFSRGLVERPAAFGVSADQAAEVAKVVAEFREALAATLVPHNRTGRTTLIKNEARRAAEAVVRPIYMQIRTNPAVGDGDLFGIGVRRPRPAVRDAGRDGPAEAPMLELCRRDAWFVARWFVAGKRGHAKPAGAAAVQLFAGRVGERAVPRLVGTFTGERARLSPDDLLHGDRALLRAAGLEPEGGSRPERVWAAGRFVGSRGLPGPMSRRVELWVEAA